MDRIVEGCLGKWTTKIEDLLTTSKRQDPPRRKPLKRLYRKQSIKQGREYANIVRENPISTVNVHHSGRRSYKPGEAKSKSNESGVLFSQSRICSERWQRQLHSWDRIKRRFHITDDRYDEFFYLCYLDIDDPFIIDYFNYHFYGSKPLIKGRLKNSSEFWESLNPPDWILDIVRNGIRIPFQNEPPIILLPNNRSCIEKKSWVRGTIIEFLEYGFVKKVDYIPHCVLPLQVDFSGEKLCLIHDEQALNKYVLKNKYKVEGWEEMYEYGWVDASNQALGGFFIEIDSEISSSKPLTANNLLRVGKGLATLRDGQQWDVDKMCQNLSTAFSTRKPKSFEVDLEIVKNHIFVHRQFNQFERMYDSNERELIAARHLIAGSIKLLKGKSATLHFDNLNASIICSKGSSKFRLHRHALYINEICRKYNIELKTVWIPRSLNEFADKMSKLIDIEDYSVTEVFFNELQTLFNVVCTFDRFANNLNCKVTNFNSASYCLGTAGVDAFKYHWGLGEMNWLFPPPRLIVETIQHLERCRGQGLLLAPKWDSSYFSPVLNSDKIRRHTIKSVILNGKDKFKIGCDQTSYFGSEFNANVRIVHLDFSK